MIRKEREVREEEKAESEDRERLEKDCERGREVMGEESIRIKRKRKGRGRGKQYRAKKGRRKRKGGHEEEA